LCKLHKAAAENVGSRYYSECHNPKWGGDHVYRRCPMIVTFFDRQDESNPLSGSTFSSPSALLNHLHELSSRPPFLCEIESENGFKLLVGIGGNWSCVQHSRIDGSPPYLMAVQREAQSNIQPIEFLIGNTPTPIGGRYVLKSKVADKVISFFVETGDKSSLVEWEEI
jgi:hypothetical protein